MSSARATIAAGANPPRVTATIPFHLPRATFQEAPGESLGIPVQFFPAHGKTFAGFETAINQLHG
jgi:hypothetical protein